MDAFPSSSVVSVAASKDPHHLRSVLLHSLRIPVSFHHLIRSPGDFSSGHMYLYGCSSKEVPVCLDSLLSLTHEIREAAGMDKKRSGGGTGEPALIKNLFRLTCTEEVPFSIYINFHPGMVIITVCPSRCIYLAGRVPTLLKAVTAKVDSSPQRPFPDLYSVTGDMVLLSDAS